MPQLPKRNSIDFNPDSTIFASKKLSAIILENLKNPLQDPDTSTLSTLSAQKSLDETFDKLEEMAGNYSSLVLRLGSFLGKAQGKVRQDVDIQMGQGRKKRGLKLKGGVLTEAELKAMDDEIGLPGFYSNLQDDQQRFRENYRDDNRNSTATPNRQRSSRKFDDEADIDDDAEGQLPTGRSFAPPRMDLGDDDGGDGGDDPRIGEALEGFVGEQVGANFNSLIFPIIQLVRRMNILVNSRIRPAISALSTSQVSRLTDIYQMIRTSYNDAIFPDTRRARKGKDPFTKTKMPITRPDPRVLNPRFIGRRESDLEEAIIDQNQFGDEILSVWNTERQALLLNLTIVINSWKQNTPTGQQTEFNTDVNRSFQTTATRLGKKAELVEAQGQQPYEGFDYDRDAADLESVSGAGRKRGRPKKTGAMTLIGNGRNFYGEEINKSRDLPTIFSGSMRNCPTKYLL